MNVLRKTIDEIETRGWGKRTLENPNGRVCALGAYSHAVGIHDTNYPTLFSHEDQVDARRSLGLLADAILENHPGAVVCSETERRASEGDLEDIEAVVIVFNDSQDSPEPVIRMLEKAAAKLDEQI
jgi:hypothetical protein